MNRLDLLYGRAGLLAFSLILIPGAALHAQYAITRSVLDMAGGMRSSASYMLVDAAGQTAMGVSSSAHYELAAGFLAFGFVLPPGIDEPGDDVVVPHAYSLSQNYPNPFNPVTTIRIEIPGNEGEKVPVLLEVFDMRGRRIRTLAEGTRLPGSYMVSWDGRDEKGESAGSGIYLYRVRAGEFTATRKMVMLK